MRSLLRRLKPFGFIIFLLGFQDLIDFFTRAWVVLEWIVVAMVVLWALGMRVAALLYIRLGKDVSFGLLKKSGGRLLWAIYWLITLATIGNLAAKYFHGYDPVKLVVLTMGYAFLLFIDYVETEESIKSINSSPIRDDSLS